MDGGTLPWQQPSGNQALESSAKMLMVVITEHLQKMSLPRTSCLVWFLDNDSDFPPPNLLERTEQDKRAKNLLNEPSHVNVQE